MTENDFDTIIIGGGPGGLSAGIYAKRAALNVLLIEKGVLGGQIVNSDEVENYLGFERVNGAELSMKFGQHAQAYDLDIVTQEVDKIIPGVDYHTVKLANGDTYRTCSIIMAMGGNPRKLNIPGENKYYGKGVSYCAVCDGFFFRDKTVVVIGGGDTAAEEALYLSKLARKVYLAHRRDELRASMILQQRIFSECKIEMLWNTIPTEIMAAADGVSSIGLEDTVTGDQREIPVDGAFIFIGFEPNNHLVPAGVKMTADGYVVTDGKCETSIPGIFAIGDLMEKYARQIITAAADGCTSALAAAHYVEAKKSSDECTLE